jgi:hypothetical protein
MPCRYDLRAFRAGGTRHKPISQKGKARSSHAVYDPERTLQQQAVAGTAEPAVAPTARTAARRMVEGCFEGHAGHTATKVKDHTVKACTDHTAQYRSGDCKKAGTVRRGGRPEAADHSARCKSRGRSVTCTAGRTDGCRSGCMVVKAYTAAGHTVQRRSGGRSVAKTCTACPERPEAAGHTVQRRSNARTARPERPEAAKHTVQWPLGGRSVAKPCTARPEAGRTAWERRTAALQTVT